MPDAERVRQPIKKKLPPCQMPSQSCLACCALCGKKFTTPLTQTLCCIPEPGEEKLSVVLIIVLRKRVGLCFQCPLCVIPQLKLPTPTFQEQITGTENARLRRITGACDTNYSFLYSFPSNNLLSTLIPPRGEKSGWHVCQTQSFRNQAASKQARLNGTPVNFVEEEESVLRPSSTLALRSESPYGTDLFSAKEAPINFCLATCQTSRNTGGPLRQSNCEFTGLWIKVCDGPRPVQIRWSGNATRED